MPENKSGGWIWGILAALAGIFLWKKKHDDDDDNGPSPNPGGEHKGYLRIDPANGHRLLLGDAPAGPLLRSSFCLASRRRDWRDLLARTHKDGYSGVRIFLDGEDNRDTLHGGGNLHAVGSEGYTLTMRQLESILYWMRTDGRRMYVFLTLVSGESFKPEYVGYKHSNDHVDGDHRRFIEAVVARLRPQPNLMYETVNEPYSKVSRAFQQEMFNIVRNADGGQHLVCGGDGGEVVGDCLVKHRVGPDNWYDRMISDAKANAGRNQPMFFNESTQAHMSASARDETNHMKAMLTIPFCGGHYCYHDPTGISSVMRKTDESPLYARPCIAEKYVLPIQHLFDGVMPLSSHYPGGISVGFPNGREWYGMRNLHAPGGAVLVWGGESSAEKRMKIWEGLGATHYRWCNPFWQSTGPFQYGKWMAIRDDKTVGIPLHGVAAVCLLQRRA